MRGPVIVYLERVGGGRGSAQKCTSDHEIPCRATGKSLWTSNLSDSDRKIGHIEAHQGTDSHLPRLIFNRTGSAASDTKFYTCLCK